MMLRGVLVLRRNKRVMPNTTIGRLLILPLVLRILDFGVCGILLPPIHNTTAPQNSATNLNSTALQLYLRFLLRSTMDSPATRRNTIYINLHDDAIRKQ